jgi:hypothetical protein
MAIKICLRDINGKRENFYFTSEDYFNQYDWSWYDDENYEILMVEYGNHCIYNALTNKKIYLEDLIGFFA